MIVATGPTSQATLTKVVESAKPAEDATWQAFPRAESSTYRCALLLPTRARRRPTRSCSTGGRRPALGVFRVAPFTMAFEYVVRADGSSGFGGGGASARDLSPPIVTIGGFSTRGRRERSARGRRRARHDGNGSAAGRVRGSVRRDARAAWPGHAHRYFASFLDDVEGKVAAVALDAAGRELARKSDMGCSVCPLLARRRVSGRGCRARW